MAHVVVVTWDDALDAEASARLERTLRAGADKVGRELQAEVLVAQRPRPVPAAVPTVTGTPGHKEAWELCEEPWPGQWARWRPSRPG
jgi:hypothetical protein